MTQGDFQVPQMVSRPSARTGDGSSTQYIVNRHLWLCAFSRCGTRKYGWLVKWSHVLDMYIQQKQLL